MNINEEKVFLRRIAASWAGRRNVAGFDAKEKRELQAMRIQGKVYTYEEDNSAWAALTEAGQNRLYELNGMKDV